MFKADWVPWFIAGLIGIVGCTALVVATDAPDDNEPAPTSIARANSAAPTPTSIWIPTRTPKEATPTLAAVYRPTAVVEGEDASGPPPTAAELTAKVQTGVGIVRDTRVKYHDADTIGITLLVDTSGQKGPARRAGDEAVRVVKAMVEGGVSSTIGAGAWEYIVVIFEPGDDDPIVVGAKRREASSIDWEAWAVTAASPVSTPTPAVPASSTQPTSVSDLVLPTIKSYALVRDAEIRRDGEHLQPGAPR